MAKTEEDIRNEQNNANVINNAADVAIASKNPYAVAAGTVVKAGDKLTGGKVSETAGKALNQVNKRTPGGKSLQKGLNKASESGMADKAGKAARVYNSRNPKEASKGSELAKEPTGKNNMNYGGRGQNEPSSNANKSDNNSERKIAGVNSTPKKDNNENNNDGENKEEDLLFGNKKRLKIIISIFLPIIAVFIFVLFLLAIIVTIITGLFSDPLGAASIAGEDLGMADVEDYNYKDQQKYFERINDVKNEYMKKGIYFDSTQIVGVFEIIMNENRKIGYDDISKSEIRKVVDAMFNETTYDEEQFRNNLVNNILPKYVKNKTPEEYNAMVDDISEYIDAYYEFIEKEDTVCSSTGSCSYSILGFSINGQNIKKQMSIDNLKVRLMQCGPPYGNGNDQTPIDQPLIDFEDYIAGVIYAEIGDSYPEEAMKAHAIMARSYALARPIAMNNAGGKKLSQENGHWVLQIASCVSDQVFCNVNEGCSYMGGGDGQGGYVVSGTNASGSIRSRSPLPTDSKLRSAVAATKGQLLTNNQGYVVSTGYASNTQNQVKSLAESGFNYKEILFKLYSDGKDITSGTCSSSCTASTGEYANWKQCDPRWGSVKLGSSTICQIGCLATSISMLIAKSGVATTLNDFNPGTFVTRMNQVGGFTSENNLVYAPVSKIAPTFVYQGQISVAGLSKTEKLNRIKTLISQGYYLTVEVKGNTGQHWVAVDTVNGDNVIMMDPATNSTNMWEQYSWNNTSTITYFKAG